MKMSTSETTMGQIGKAVRFVREVRAILPDAARAAVQGAAVLRDGAMVLDRAASMLRGWSEKPQKIRVEARR